MMAPLSFTFVLVVLIVGLHLLTGGCAAAFVLGFNKSIIGNKRTKNQNTIVIRSEETALLLSFQPQQRPPPRRALKKRKNKRRERMESAIKNTNTLNINSNSKNNNNNNNNNIFGSGDNDYDADEIEIRPIRRKDAVQAGMDYWIDDSDFEREKQRRIAIKNRKAMEGSISKERLRDEVVAPYKQNWIGLFSMVIVILSTIVIKFPEVIETPIIKIPDL